MLLCDDRGCLRSLIEGGANLEAICRLYVVTLLGKGSFGELFAVIIFLQYQILADEYYRSGLLCGAAQLDLYKTGERV